MSADSSKEPDFATGVVLFFTLSGLLAWVGAGIAFVSWCAGAGWRS